MSVRKGGVTSFFDHPKGFSGVTAASSKGGHREMNPLELDAPERDALVREARRIYAHRQARSRYLPMSFFSDPAWDLLLVLYFEAGERPMTATGVAQVTNTPETTALRWVETLEGAGLVSSHTHASDRRLRLLSLSSPGRAMMDQYLISILRN